MIRTLAKSLGSGVLLYFLLFFGLTRVGLLGPDEPRYASIGREMATSGDWITPRLWGEPWFEKPPLLYWMIGAAYALGASDDLAPRIGVALLSVAFLVLFYAVLSREFDRRTALYSTLILATCAGWLAFSHIGVTDLPLAACFGASMLLALQWVHSGDRRWLPWSGALLGLAILAKALVPVVLVVPLVWIGRKRWRDLVIPALITIGVAAPWFVLSTIENGRVVWDELIWRHHFERFGGESLGHVRPFWFYAPVMLAALFPWTPLVVLLFKRDGWSDPRVKLAALWLGWGFVFFSVATNKLPGYVLPLLPAAALLIGIRIVDAQRPFAALAAVGLLVGLIPAAGSVLPDALTVGLSRASLNPIGVAVFLGAALMAIAALSLSKLASRTPVMAAIAIAATWGAVSTKWRVYPVLDRDVSARVPARQMPACIPSETHRNLKYGLAFYTGSPLPECALEKNLPKKLNPQSGNGLY